MYIRRAKESDMPGINKLLNQVLMVHHNGRPDLFKGGVRKYTEEELAVLIQDDAKPIFVGVDESDRVLGYAFCVFIQHLEDNILTDIKTLYIEESTESSDFTPCLVECSFTFILIFVKKNKLSFVLTFLSTCYNNFFKSFVIRNISITCIDMFLCHNNNSSFIQISNNISLTPVNIYGNILTKYDLIVNYF